MNIDVRFFKGRQSWNYTRIYVSGSLAIGNLGEHKLRVTIKRDSLDAQSYARCDRWDGTKWQQVCSIPIKHCLCHAISYVESDTPALEGLFAADSTELLELAKKIIA